MYSLGACIMQNKNKTFQSYMYAVLWCVIAIFIDQSTQFKGKRQYYNNSKRF